MIFSCSFSFFLSLYVLIIFFFLRTNKHRFESADWKVAAEAAATIIESESRTESVNIIKKPKQTKWNSLKWKVFQHSFFHLSYDSNLKLTRCDPLYGGYTVRKRTQKSQYKYGAMKHIYINKNNATLWTESVRDVMLKKVQSEQCSVLR